VPLGLDFKGLQLCCALISNYLLQEYQVVDMGALSWLSAEILERLPTPLIGRLVG